MPPAKSQIVIPSPGVRFSTAGQACFIAAFVDPINAITAGTAAVSPNANNQVTVWMCSLKFGITIRKVVITTGAALAAHSVNFGFYSLAGNLLLDSGGFSLAATATLSNTLGTPVYLPPGMYYFAEACSSTGGLVMSLSTSLGAATGTVLNKNANRSGFKATNNMTGVPPATVLPATLGALVAGGTATMALVLFES